MVTYPDSVTRKISNSGQIYIPPAFRLVQKFYVPEPGIFFQAEKVRLYPEMSPPVFQSETVFDGEQLLVTMTSQGQITIPSRFRKKVGMEAGDRVVIRRDDDEGYLTVTKEETTSE